MQKLLISTVIALISVTAYWGQVQASVLPVASTEVAVVETSSTSAIDTLLGSSRVKRNGGCGCCGCGGGCGCGCCCCRPKCCCCCRRCCTCCCTRCCTCCRPCCCCCGCGGGGGGCGCCGCGGGCGCCGGCGGCGCCGCGGGGRKRRSLQNMKIDHANRMQGIKRIPSAEKC